MRFLAAPALAAILAASTALAADRTSVVLITLDTTRADHLGCYGAAGAETPSLDALARRGTVFESALSPVPLTFPAHASLMSGRVPRRHGVRDNALYRLEPGVPLLAEALRKAGYRTAAFVSAAVLDRGLGLARGFETYDDDVRIGDRRAFNYEERAASQTADRAIGRLATLAPPYFLWVHFFDPHLPYVPPEPFRTTFKDRLYDGEIAFMDREVGRLLDAVGKKGGSVIVAVAGDHGESLGEHGEAGHGVFVYQATQHVPLLLAGPGIARGKRIAGNVGLVDVAPTILDLLGLPPLQGADGRSLAPVLRSGSRGKSPDYEMETLYPRFAYGWSGLHALVRGTVKYIDAPRPELYDLGVDPRETRNLSSTSESAANSLREALDKLSAGDTARRDDSDPELAEQRRRLEALGYVSTGAAPPERGAATVDPKDGIAWIADLESARRDLQLGDPRDGIPKLERLLGRNPGNLQARLALVQCRLATGDATGAVAEARLAVEASPREPSSWFNLANALAAKGPGDPAARSEAASAYEKTLSLDPRRADVYLVYALMLVQDRRADDARKVLDRAVTEGIHDPDVETEIGLMELGRKSPAAAASAFERAIALNPGASIALESLGKIAYGKGDFKRAAGFYARALDAQPTASRARTLGSILLYQLDDRAGALRAFRRAVELAPPNDPDTPAVLEILGGLESK